MRIRSTQEAIRADPMDARRTGRRPPRTIAGFHLPCANSLRTPAMASRGLIACRKRVGLRPTRMNGIDETAYPRA